MHRAHFEVVADVDQRHWWFLARRRILRDVLACIVPPDPDSIIIDVGCGTGANIAALARDYHCVGIDTSADAIEFAKTRFPNVEFLTGYAPRDLGSTATKARATLLMDVLEHVEDDRAVLEPIVDSMQPGSYLVLTVPADMRLWSPHDEGVLHYRRYDESMLRALWGGLPIELVVMTHFCSRLYPLARVSRSISRMKELLIARESEWGMSVPISPINRMLGRVFAGESPRLVDLVQGRRRAGYARGVSLMAILRRAQPMSKAEGHTHRSE